MKLNFTIFSLLIFIQSFSQTPNNQENVKNLVETYFHYDREIIHVQFNKTIYVNNEIIAFKGYVINKNKYLPDANTTNVQLAIYNEQKQLIQKHLLFTSLGTFEGGIRLNEKFTSGKYYFHFYTNWMNNFIEDDSFTQEVEIINRNEPYYAKSKEPNWKTAKIEFFPESGKIINSIVNKVGIKLTDCNHKGIKTEGKIFDSKSNEIAQFKTNEMGNGSFYLTPDNNEKYSIQIKTEKINLTESVPTTQNTGLAISYNNNLSNNILAIVIKTNDAGATLYQNKKLTLLLHQNGNSILKDFMFEPNETEKTLRFDKSNLANGVNTIRVIDENLNELAERLVYIESNLKPEITLEAKTIANDSLVLSVKSNSQKSNLSISLLPENNTCVANKSSIIGTMYLNGYLDQPEGETYFYFDNDNKTRKLDMELLLLNQNKNKYLWTNIKSNPPKIKHPFTQGITIKGNVEKKLAPNSKFKISLIAMKNKIFEEAPVDKNNQFTFENISVLDSTVVLLQMMNEKNVVKNDKINANVVLLDSISVFQPRINLTNCPLINNSSEPFNFAKLGLDKNTIKLNDIVIKGTSKKTQLVHKEKNAIAKAYKINDNEFGTLLDYINKTGDYRTGFGGTDNSVYIKNRQNSFVRTMDATPTVYIDDLEVFDLNFLLNLSIEEVDEIYIDKMGFSNTNPGGLGTIKIYLKEGVKNNIFQTKNASFLITNGFAKNIVFNNAPFETTKEFNYFGTLSWTPKVEIEANKSYEIKSLKANQKEIQVLLEGFTEDGQLVSEIRKIPVSNL